MGTDRRRRRLRKSSRAAEAVGQPTATVGEAVDSPTAAGPAVELDSSEAAAPAVKSAASEAAAAAPRSPTPHDLAELGGTFAMTAGVLDPDDAQEEARSPEAARAAEASDEPGNRGSEWTGDEPAGRGRPADDPHAERGLRGLVGGGSSQVSVEAALRARDASRPTEADVAAAEAELVIVRRGWVPREDLPPRGPRR